MARSPCVKWEAQTRHSINVSVHVSACVPRVTAACQGPGLLLQMVPATRSQGPQAPSHSLTRGRGSHGPGAHGLIAVAWPLGPLGPLGSLGSSSRDSPDNSKCPRPVPHPPPTSLRNTHIYTNPRRGGAGGLLVGSLTPLGRRCTI